MLRRLMVRLGADETHAQAVLASAPQVERAQLQETDGQTRLRVDEPFDRSWRRVGLALDRVGFTVEDRDRAKGIYFVRYIDPEVDNDTSQEGGFFSKLLFWRSKEKAVASGGEYRILLADRGEDVLVSVLTREGGADSSPTARKILELLHKELR
jgi:outer membrane protein assembly factor BamC